MIKHLQFISGCGKENYEQPVKKITALYCRLSHDDEQEKIGTIIVKDHSRLRRNRLVVGQLLEKDFDRINVRYIAIMDNIDTANGISDFVPMQDLFNEWHAKNTSQKVKNVFHNKGMSRIPFTSNLPYSHKKDPKMPRFMSANKRGHSESFWKHADSASMFALRNFPQSAMTLQPTPCQYESDKSLEQQHSETDISSRTSTVCNSLSCPTLHAYKYFEDKSIWKKASAYAIMPLGKKDAKNAM